MAAPLPTHVVRGVIPRTWSGTPIGYPLPLPPPGCTPDTAREDLAYIVTLNPDGIDGHGAPVVLVVTDVNPASPTYETLVGRVDISNAGVDRHHFG